MDSIERLRREADISARPGQMDRLNALADEFAAALEAAREDGVKFVELVESSKELLTEWDRQDNGRFDTMSAKWWEEAEARFRIAVAESEGRSLECNCPGSGKAFASQHAPNCPARPIYVLNPGERNGNGI